MILEFAVENFRSIKDRQVFSMIAEPSKAKGENVFEVPLANGSSIRLLKTAVIYGANASGKSNLIRALNSLVKLVRNRFERINQPIKEFNPFLFSKETKTMPTVFELSFLLEDIKFNYRISFVHTHIVEEELIYFPKGQSQRIFKRDATENELGDKVKLGKNWGNKTISVFKNQPVLNKYGTEDVDNILSRVYLLVSEIEFNDIQSSSSNNYEIQRTSQKLFLQDRQKLFKRLEKLIRAADTKVNNLNLFQEEIYGYGVSFTNPKYNEDDEETFSSYDNKITRVQSKHKVYDNHMEVGLKELDFDEESEGTKALFWRGGLILEKLEKGGVLIFDELDNSLHPKLVKFLVKLFTHPLSNPHNAQLIFATHEVTLLDRDLFRTDQIWITEKNEFGETELYSVQDFEGVREDIPFDKWYMAGKFGGQPKIDDIESIFSNE